jgi:hypothetical protein
MNALRQLRAAAGDEGGDELLGGGDDQIAGHRRDHRDQRPASCVGIGLAPLARRGAAQRATAAATAGRTSLP